MSRRNRFNNTEPQSTPEAHEEIQANELESNILLEEEENKALELMIENSNDLLATQDQNPEDDSLDLNEIQIQEEVEFTTASIVVAEIEDEIEVKEEIIPDPAPEALEILEVPTPPKETFALANKSTLVSKEARKQQLLDERVKRHQQWLQWKRRPKK